MRATSFRFAAPPLAWSPRLEWVFDAAFAGSPGVAPPAGAWELARSLDLAERIASRRPELPDASGLRHRSCARELVLARAIEELRAAPPPHGPSPVLLKFAALYASGRLAPGSRPAADIDVLVNGRDGPAWIEALRGAGFGGTGQPDYEHQWPALRAPCGVAVEVHRVLLGVRFEGRRSCDSRDLGGHGLLAPAGPFAPLQVPVAEVLLAHALVHALAQHGLAPRAYALTRLLTDAVDLGLADSAGDALLDRSRPWIARAVSAAEADAVRDLCRALVAGAVTRLDEGGNARRLLDHVVAGALDERYRESLKLRWLGPPLSDSATAAALWRHWRSTLQPRAGAGRAPRLFDLARRGARAALRRLALMRH